MKYFVAQSKHAAGSSHLVALEVDQHENLPNLLHRNVVAGEFGVLHHLAELVGLDGERAADARAGREAVVLEDCQEYFVEGSNYLFHLLTQRRVVEAREGTGG